MKNTIASTITLNLIAICTILFVTMWYVGINVTSVKAEEKPTHLLVFTRDLKIGSQNPQVMFLQKLLAAQPLIYPEGAVTGYFGPRTRAAVMRLQERYADQILFPIGLSKGTGFVGSLTRAILNQLAIETGFQF